MYSTSSTPSRLLSSSIVRVACRFLYYLGLWSLLCHCLKCSWCAPSTLLHITSSAQGNFQSKRGESNHSLPLPSGNRSSSSTVTSSNFNPWLALHLNTLETFWMWSIKLWCARHSIRVTLAQEWEMNPRLTSSPSFIKQNWVNVCRSPFSQQRHAFLHLNLPQLLFVAPSTLNISHALVLRYLLRSSSGATWVVYMESG